jgi:acetolactate synthase I/II/III large subunit
MAERPVMSIPVTTGAEAFLEQVRGLKTVRYMFANTGTDHGPIIEALAKTAREDPTDIQPIVVPHEMAAVSMAHGYYNVTHKPQMVLVHTLPGTCNALGGLLNAQSSNVPLLLVAGRTPITEGELRGGKNQHIHWRQESRDQGALVREFVKWDYELRTNQNIATVVRRAFNVAMSEPRGPVYLTLPREWLCETLQAAPQSAHAAPPATKTQADTTALEQAAEILCAAEKPLIITKYLGRNPEAVAYLVELAELLSIPVAQQLNYVNFPTDHPLYLGTETAKHAKDADIIFLIDVDTPWDKANRDFLRSDAKIIHLERDPLFTSIPVWGFSADLAITGCSEIALPVLNSIIKAKLERRANSQTKFAERREEIRAEHDAMERQAAVSVEAAKTQEPISPVWVSKCIGDLMDGKTIVVNEAVTSRLAEVLPLWRPGSLFSTPPAGHLGWGLGAAIGMKLGAPEATVIAAEGDGAYIFAAPTACHFTAQKYRIPFLTVVYNNQAWNASINAARGLYPDGVAQKTRNFPGCDLSPSPQFELTAQACGAYAVRVEAAGELPDALRRALKAVKEERRQALVNVICKSPLA